MDFLYAIFIDPFVQMVELPDFLLQVLWEGFVAGVLYALIALGFVLIFKASGVFNFAQGIMVVFAALTLVGLHEKGVPAYLALILTIGVMGLLALAVERFVMRPLVNQPDIILFMATIGLTYFLIGFGEFIFGGEPKQMIASELGLPTGSTAFEIGDGGLLILQHIDIAAAVIAIIMVGCLAVFFNKTRIGRALRAVADDHQAALVGGHLAQPDLGHRLVCRGHRGADHGHHVGCEARMCPSRWKSSRSRRCRCSSLAASPRSPVQSSAG
jgi:branched-chain amino acid transport system permease protein